MKTTKFSYDIAKSIHSKHFFYVIEKEKDEFGETKRAISKPLSLEELANLKGSINQILVSIKAG